jgi:hypothetical protein
MIVIWGTKDREENRGLVADFCQSCQKPRAFAIVAHFVVNHIYYISLGKGTLNAMLIRCQSCGAQYRYDEGRYAATLDPAFAGGRPFSELLEKTNPGLSRQLARDKTPPRRTRDVQTRLDIDLETVAHGARVELNAPRGKVTVDIPPASTTGRRFASRARAPAIRRAIFMPR